MMKLLVVDDDLAVLGFTVRLLQTEGYDVRQAGSGEEGLALLRQLSDVGVIISDQRMPGMTGVEFLSRTRELVPGAIRILLTGFTDMEACIAAINEGGASHYLTKPIQEEHFLRTVRESVTLLEVTRERAILLETVNRQNQELRSWQVELESRVVSQTREIQLKNEELTKAYARLQATKDMAIQQEKMAAIGQLAAGVAHEINNPIGFIASNLRTLSRYRDKLVAFMTQLQQVLTAADQPELDAQMAFFRQQFKLDYILEDIGQLVQESLAGTEHMGKIVSGLKSFSYADKDVLCATDLNECLDNTIQMVWNEIKYKAELHRNFGTLPTIQCNAQQLKQIFMNLLVNAAHSIDQRGEITITTRHQDGQILISFADTGCGIPPEHLSRIFEPFFTTKEIGKGTGLGLSIAFELIKKHGGDISVTSQIGSGTIFTLQLPCSNEGAPDSYLPG